MERKYLISSALAVAVVLEGFAGVALAATVDGTWNVQNSGKWGTGSNWASGSVPNGSAATISFNALTLTKNIVVSVVDKNGVATDRGAKTLLFDTGTPDFSYTIAGPGTLSFGPGGSVNVAAQQTAHIDAGFTASTWSKTGEGTLEVGGSAANTSATTMAVKAGTLALNKTAGTAAIAGDLAVGDGTANSDGSADTVRLMQSDQIANASSVTVAAHGLFDAGLQTDQVTNFSGAGALGISLGGSSAGAITTTGTLDVSTLTLDLTQVSPLSQNVYVLANYSNGGLVGEFAATNGLGSGQVFYHGLDGQTNSIVYVVPEPASLSLAALGCCGLLLRRRGLSLRAV